MSKTEFIERITYLEDKKGNTENFLSLLQDNKKINNLNCFYKIVKDIFREHQIEVLPSYNIFSKEEKERNLEILYVKINENDIEELNIKYGIIKEEDKTYLVI